MQTVDRTGVHIDVCQDCQGIFLDRGELERLVDAAIIYRQAAEAREAEQQATQAAPAPTGYYPEDTPVATQPPPYQPEPGYAPPPPPYGAPPVPPGYGYDPYGHDPRYHRRRKKKDILSELFDL